MGSLGFPELVIILVIIIMIFGANRLPDIGRGIGKGIRTSRKRPTRASTTATTTPEARSRTRRLALSPTRRVTRSRSRYSSSGIANFLRQSIPALEPCDIHVSLGASLLERGDVALQRVERLAMKRQAAHYDERLLPDQQAADLRRPSPAATRSARPARSWSGGMRPGLPQHPIQRVADRASLPRREPRPSGERQTLATDDPPRALEVGEDQVDKARRQPRQHPLAQLLSWNAVGQRLRRRDAPRAPPARAPGPTRRQRGATRCVPRVDRLAGLDQGLPRTRQIRAAERPRGRRRSSAARPRPPASATNKACASGSAFRASPSSGSEQARGPLQGGIAAARRRAARPDPGRLPRRW